MRYLLLSLNPAECDSPDRTIDAARRIPGALTGAIEVRPIMEFD